MLSPSWLEAVLPCSPSILASKTEGQSETSTLTQREQCLESCSNSPVLFSSECRDTTPSPELAWGGRSLQPSPPVPQRGVLRLVRRHPQNPI